MTVDKMSLSFDAHLGDDIRAAAARSGKSLSAWLGEAAADKLRSESLAEFLREYEATYGAFTEEEMAQADAAFGVRPAKADAAA